MPEADQDNAVRRKRTTMRDVGARAGVSFKTVSRVVNGEAGVSPAVTNRVQAAIEALGYRRDRAASILRRRDGRTGTVAVILEDLANPFSAALHRAVVDAMRAEGVLVLSANSDEDPAEERAAFEAFAERRVDGVILMPTNSDHAWIDEERAAGNEVVMVDRPAPGATADVVVSDNRRGAARATTHLLRRGHRRIAFLGFQADVYTTAERLAGFRDALGAAGAENDLPVLTGLRGSNEARDAVIELLTGPSPPSALFTSQNLATIGGARALRQLGLQHQVAQVGFDDVELADLLEPGITVVKQAPSELGSVAAAQLLSRLDGQRSPARQFVVPTRLVPRGSGEIAPRQGPARPPNGPAVPG